MSHADEVLKSKEAVVEACVRWAGAKDGLFNVRAVAMVPGMCSSERLHSAHNKEEHARKGVEFETGRYRELVAATCPVCSGLGEDFHAGFVPRCPADCDDGRRK